MSDLLEGITVIELAEGWTGAAIGGRLLADLGAEVIKIEPSGGDPLRRRPPLVGGESLAFTFVAAGKRSVVIDPADASEKDRLTGLIAGADIVLDGYSGSARPFEPDFDELQRRNPGLIYCLVSTFGRLGGLASWTGADLLAQATSGLMASTGLCDAPPTRVGAAVGDYAGAIAAVTAIGAALIHRRRSGHGQIIDIATRDCLFSFHSSYLPKVFLEGSAPSRMGFRHPMIAPWDAYRAKHGRVIVCTGTDAHWREILRVVGRPDLIGDPRYDTPAQRVRNADRIQEVIEAWTRRRTIGEIVATFEEIGVPSGPILDIPEMLDHPQLRARDMLTEVETGDGRTLPVSGSIFKFSATPGFPRGAAPPPGRDLPAAARGGRPTHSRSKGS